MQPEAIGAEPSERGARRRVVSRVLLGVLFIVAGVMHFVKPAPYADIIPPMLPHPLALVFISGAFEVLGGAGVLLAPVRKWAGYGLIALLLAVFPANIYMFARELHAHGWTAFVVVLLLRLPLQLPLIWWAWRVAHQPDRR